MKRSCSTCNSEFPAGECPNCDKKKKKRNIIKVGQIWQDFDIRFRNQSPCYKKILKISGNYAYCESVYNNKIRHVKIRLDRFKPNATGYILVDSKEE